DGAGCRAEHRQHEAEDHCLNAERDGQPGTVQKLTSIRAEEINLRLQRLHVSARRIAPAGAQEKTPVCLRRRTVPATYRPLPRFRRPAACGLSYGHLAC